MHGSLLRVKFPEYYAGVTDNIFNQTRRLMLALDNVWKVYILCMFAV